jgi:DNA-directed RNA polymerases I, II, and III subunit RPABC3
MRVSRWESYFVLKGKAVWRAMCRSRIQDPDGVKFDRVSRVICQSETYEMQMILDVNTQLYPVGESDRLSCAIARTLHEDGAPDEGSYNPLRRGSLADKYEYVMNGKVYRCEEDAGSGSVM